MCFFRVINENKYYIQITRVILPIYKIFGYASNVSYLYNFYITEISTLHTHYIFKSVAIMLLIFFDFEAKTHKKTPFGG